MFLLNTYYIQVISNIVKCSQSSLKTPFFPPKQPACCKNENKLWFITHFILPTIPRLIFQFETALSLPFLPNICNAFKLNIDKLRFMRQYHSTFASYKSFKRVCSYFLKKKKDSF